jgi:hypothetical protein
MGLLKQVDKSFTRNTEPTFQAINSKGFAIEVLRPLEPVEPTLVTAGDRLVPMYLAGLDMLLSVPEASEIVIAEDGFLLRIRVPDPAAYVLHKLWVADRPDRRPDKARRDRKQELAVARLIREQLPNYGFDIDRVQNFPEPLLDYLEQVAAFDALIGSRFFAACRLFRSGAGRRWRNRRSLLPCGISTDAGCRAGLGAGKHWAGWCPAPG